MENLIVVSKVKKFIKEGQGLSTSASFIEQLSKVVESKCQAGIEEAQRSSRKTVMGRDLKIQGTSEGDTLVVASKVKKLIREKSSFSTSSQVFDAMSHELRAICSEAAEKARVQGRKTVLDRDLAPELLQ